MSAEGKSRMAKRIESIGIVSFWRIVAVISFIDPALVSSSMSRIEASEEILVGLTITL
jgi:hypothetical protein